MTKQSLAVIAITILMNTFFMSSYAGATSNRPQLPNPRYVPTRCCRVCGAIPFKTETVNYACVSSCVDREHPLHYCEQACVE